ncbi:MAG: two pore domain potassium channel family protein [Planctomycetes bacterium]|nr:two pore domain potassium channel family protein [Planctomycetota bacterium]
MHYSQWKYTILLVAMFLMLGTHIEANDLLLRTVVTDTCITLLVLAGMFAIFKRNRSRTLTFTLGLPVLILAAWARVEPAATVEATFVLRRVAMGLFLGFVMVTILDDLLSQPKITRDSLVGAFCGYLLIGAIWTELYCGIDVVAPGSITRTESESSSPQTNPEVRRNQLQYFSFVTLSTVGYGDILPTSRVTRVLACLEAICGQFYLAVLVAGLVSIRVGQFTGEKPLVSQETTST